MRRRQSHSDENGNKLLTRRQSEILALLAQGYSGPEIAEQLALAISSVRSHLLQIYGKLGANSKRQALTRAAELGLLETPAPTAGALPEAQQLAPLATMSLAAAAGPLHNLPAPTTAFVGRERELAALADYLANPHVRLLTILGLGGMGKTRLALAAAAAQLDGDAPPPLFPQGVIFVGLARLETPAQLVPAIAEALRLRFQPGREPQAQLLDHLRGKALLLVLDNFEHLRAAASLVDAILSAAAQVKVLVTSREKLNLQAEQLVPIGGMALPAEAGPDADRPLASYSAIQLLCERAQRVRPDFVLNAANQQAVVEICRLVQGLPLGIVLAAAWLETHAPAAIAAEIHANLDFLAGEMADMPERQRSLRAAFNYAWRLLPEQERTVFQNLSTFRGGFTRPAAAAVAGATEQDLQGLVNKSLLALSAEGRYEVHELLRQFAAEQLAAAPEPAAAVRDQHSAYYCQLLSEHDDSRHNAQQFETLNLVTLEADNVQRAWQWAVERADWLRLEPAMDSWAWYYEWRGRDAEAYAVFQTIVTSAATADADGRVAEPTLYLVWAKALTWQGYFAGSNDNLQQAFQQSLHVLGRPELAAARVDIRRAKAFTLNLYTYYSPDWVTARQYAEQSLALYRDCGDAWGMAIGLGNLAWLDWRTGHYAQAQAYAQAGLALHQARGDVPEQLHTSSTLAWIYMHLGRLAEGLQLRREILELCQRSGFRSHLLNATLGLVYTLLWQGRFDEARQWADQSLALCLEEGPQSWESYVRLTIRTAQIFAGQYVAARQEAVPTAALSPQDVMAGVEASEHWVLGYLALAEADSTAARAEFAESRRLYVDPRDIQLGPVLAGPGYAACGDGQLALAGQHFVEALQFALSLQDYITLILALPGVALWLALTGQIVRAVEVWALALTLPFVANSQWYADVVGQRVEAAALALTPAAREAARERGQALDLWATAEALVLEMQQ